MKGSCWLLAIGCWFVPGGMHAQQVAEAEAIVESPSTTGTPLRPWQIGLWGGAAFNSEFDTRLGTRRRDFFVAAIRVGRQIAGSPQLAIDYFVEVFPLLRSTNNPVDYFYVGCAPPPAVCERELMMRTETAHGYGITPIGLQVRTFAGRRVQPTLGLNLGAVWYEKPVPDPEEKRLNFMGDLTLGVQILAGRSTAVLVGIRQNHTSNAGTGRVNPGLDSRVVYVGATRTLGNWAQR